MSKITIASRKSDLARLQSYTVGDALKAKNPELEIQYHFRESLGDKNLNDPLWKMPEKGVFTADLSEGLAQGKFDLVVHSWKDLPTQENSETVVLATLARADARDLLLAPKGRREARDLAGRRNLNILSSSPRREYNLQAFLAKHWPHQSIQPIDNVHFIPVRGNILTRVQKLFSGDEDALIVAKAALDRLLTENRAEFQESKKILTDLVRQSQWMILPLSLNPTAAAQGALAIEIRRGRNDLKELLSKIHDVSSFEMVEEERNILRQFGGGCHQKLGISLQPHRHGRVLNIRGEESNRRKLLRPNEAVASENPDLDSSIKAFSSGSLQWSRREPINISLPANEGIYVSHPEALPTAWSSHSFEKKFVWTAGTSSWAKLASQNIWVHGTDDSLGESLPQIEHLANTAVQWTKLSHENAGGLIPLSPTYRLADLPVNFDAFANCTHFFWKSAKHLHRALELAPQILSAHHSCGMGHSSDEIQSLIAPNKVHIFLDESDWRSHFGLNRTL